MSTKEDTSMDINQIMSIIPHRYPFLLVDRITEIVVGKSIIGIKNVTANEPQFTGHFPSRPIMPGVLIIEAMAQLSAVLVAKSMDSTEDKEVFFMSIDESIRSLGSQTTGSIQTNHVSFSLRNRRYLNFNDFLNG